MMEENIRKMGTMMRGIAKLVGIALLRLADLLSGAALIWLTWNHIVVLAFQTSHFPTPPATYMQVFSVWLLVYVVRSLSPLRFADKKAE